VDQGLIRDLLAAGEQGRSVVLATVIATDRSVPRHAGSKMLVFRDGSTQGTIGGGEMEARVIREALGCLADGKPRLVDYNLVDPSSGDPGVCGGSVHLYLEPYMPTPTVFVIGCGHVGRAVVDLAHWMGFRVVAYDDRPEHVEPDALTNADVVLSGDLAEAMRNHPPTAETHVVMVTRNVALDLSLLPTVLTSEARTIGLMGSKRRWDTTRARLAELGVTEEQISRVHSPIGIELQAETPEEIAVSILAEIVACRRGAH
jgi:xanthine dehydrogenase accessory factor